MRAVKALPRPIPPMSVVYRLMGVYRGLFRHWGQLIEHTIVARWESNPSGAGRADATQGPKPPAVASAWVQARLEDLRRNMMVDVNLASFKSHINAAGEAVDTKVTNYVRRLIPAVSVRNSTIGPRLDKFREDNLAKITALSGLQVDKLRIYLSDSEADGRSTEDMRKGIKTLLGVSESKADLLARDQVLKFNGQIMRERQTQSGISLYVWDTSGDERVREGHADLDGETFSWDDPPDTGQGELNHPGMDYQCRCVALPVLPSIEDLDPIE